jgi:hypothetical protein
MKFNAMICRLVGCLFIAYGIYQVWLGIDTYQAQRAQAEWRVAMAEVIAVESYRESSGRGYVTEYNVTYRYYVNADTYTGTIRGTRVRYQVDDRFDIKYDPVNSENSTHILTPKEDALAINVVGGLLFAVMGILASGLWGAFRRRCFPRTTDERERFYEK